MSLMPISKSRSQEEVDTLSKKHKSSYRCSLSSYGLLWPHLLGRLKKEIDSRAFSTIALTRGGSEIDGGRCPTTKKWTMALGVTATLNGRLGHERMIVNNYMMIYLLPLLMDAAVFVGIFKAKSSCRPWCTKQSAHDYLEFVKSRVCP